jgi:hypothetical protein
MLKVCSLIKSINNYRSMKSKYIFTLLALVVFFVVQSCDSEDILPGVTLSSSDTNFSENNGSVTIAATLNAVTVETISIPLSIAGTATQSADYSLSNAAITIAAGSDVGSIVITGLQDNEVEGEESLIITLGNSSGFISLSNGSLTVFVQDDDIDSDNDGILDANDDCPNTAGEVSNNGCPFLGFLINEVLYDPASGAAGDANGDGTRDANGDEFVELFNSGPILDISGYTVSDESQLRHTFPAGSVIPINGTLVLFGGGTPTGSFGGAILQVASEGALNITNSGDILTIRDTTGATVLVFDNNLLSGNPDESYTRNPDLTGELEQHAGIPEANGALFSPGTRLDGFSL